MNPVSIQQLPSKDHPEIPNLLHMVAQWRSDHFSEYDLNSKDDAIKIILWWLRWGHKNFDLNALCPFDQTWLNHFFSESKASCTLLDGSYRLPNIFHWIYNHIGENEGFSIKNKPEQYICWCYLDATVSYHLHDVWSSDVPLTEKMKSAHTDSPYISFFLNTLYFAEASYQDAFNLDTIENQLTFVNWWAETCQSRGHNFLTTINNELTARLRDKVGTSGQSQQYPALSAAFTCTKESPPQIKADTVPEFGVNLIGMYSSPIGIAEDTRLIHEALKQAKIPTKVYDIENADTFNSLPKYKINLFTLPAPNIAITSLRLNPAIFEGRVNIASTPWELPHWPESLYWMFSFFDQIWVHSDYVLDSIPKQLRNKVAKIPLPVLISKNIKSDRPSFNLDENDYIFFTSFDFSSYSARKNPYASIDAFLLAKDKYLLQKNCKLIIKTVNGRLHKEIFKKLEALARTKKDIILIDKSLSKKELHSLYKTCNCFVSLHRSEGFGRNIAESMLLGIPVIVTGYSGNMDFCNDSNAYLVKYKMINLAPTDYIFSHQQFWAEPCIIDAAKKMALVARNEANNIKLINNAKKNIEENYSIKALSEKIPLINYEE
jgi:glycosyltransferase involved in cell wall biosynthesis